VTTILTFSALASLAANLHKYTPRSGGLLSKKGTWQERHMVLSSFHGRLRRSQSVVPSLHAFRSHINVDMEVERLELSSKSIVCVSDEPP
jgi:hypothetical protein